ncbi:MAG: hypothetical protein LBJ41_02825 [Treponema sp.]|jgi:hypothetical protein|nr:hypothetical protein [Treponema sp.]
MNERTDWFPTTREKQLEKARTWIHVLLPGNPPPFGVPQGEAEGLKTITDEAGNSLELAVSGDRTPVIIAKCRDDFNHLKKKMRFIKSRYFIGLTDAELASLGLRPHKAHSPIPPPEGFPEADVSYPGVHTLDLRLRPVAGQPTFDMRSGYGYRIYWGVMPPGGATVEAAIGEKRELMKPPTSGKELSYSRWTRRRKERFKFDGDSGKTVFFCIRYENSKGEVGEFGPLFSAIIP